MRIFALALAALFSIPVLPPPLGAVNWTFTDNVTGQGARGITTTGLITHGPYVDVRSFGTITLGSGASAAQKTANANAIQAAIDAATSGSPQMVLFPPGIIYVDGNSIAISAVQTGVWIKGSGIRGTQLFWDSGVGIKVGAAGGQMAVHNRISDLVLVGQGSAKKTGIQLIDIDSVVVENIYILASGNTSTGLEIQGRNLAELRNLTITADRPIHIKDNPNSTFDIDHFHFENLYLTVTDNTQRNVTIDDGVNLSNVTFDGAQAWVQGKGGLYWNDTTTRRISNSLVLKNVRWEQATDDGSGWLVYINHNYGLNTLLLENVYGATHQSISQSTNGVYLHKIINAEIKNSILTAGELGSSRTTFSIDNTTYPVTFTNMYWFQAGVKSVGIGLFLKEYREKDDRYGVVRAVYDTNTNFPDYFTDDPYSTLAVTIDNGSISGFGSSRLIGMLNIVTNKGPMAIYSLRGNAATVEVADPDSRFSPKAENNGFVNIYYSAANAQYEIQNLSGSALKFRWFIVGGARW